MTFDIQEGEIFGLIGPNGAGKTTLFNAITAIFPPTEGRIELAGESIVGKHAARSQSSVSAAPSNRSGCFPT